MHKHLVTHWEVNKCSSAIGGRGFLLLQWHHLPEDGCKARILFEQVDTMRSSYIGAAIPHGGLKQVHREKVMVSHPSAKALFNKAMCVHGNAWNDNLKLPQFLSLFTGNSMVWFNNCLRRSISSWDKLVEQFMSYFQSMEVTIKIKHLKLWKKGSIESTCIQRFCTLTS